MASLAKSPQLPGGTTVPDSELALVKPAKNEALLMVFVNEQKSFWNALAKIWDAPTQPGDFCEATQPDPDELGPEKDV